MLDKLFWIVTVAMLAAGVWACFYTGEPPLRSADEVAEGARLESRGRQPIDVEPFKEPQTVEALTVDRDGNLVLISRQVQADNNLAASVFTLSPEQAFVWMVCGNRWTMNEAREKAVQKLKSNLDSLSDVVTLSDEQRAKLELAGYGDISYFFDELEQATRTYAAGLSTAQEQRRIQRELKPLATRYRAGLHRDESLFWKTLPTALNPEQLEMGLRWHSVTP